MSWSDATGNLTLYHDGVKKNTIANVHGSFRLNAYLNLGSSNSAINIEVTQVRLWSSASVQSYYNYMIDPASVQTGDGTKLLAYYPFSTASTFTGPTENNAFTNAGSIGTC